MRSDARQLLPFAVMGFALAAAVGCSHDPLDSGAHALAVRFTPNPGGTGRYERATMDIQTIQALPTDPVAGTVYTSADTLLFRFENFPVNLAETAPVLYSTIALGEGPYQITKFEITAPSLVDETDLPPNPATCIEGVAVVDRSVPGVPASFVFVNAPELTFTVRPGQTSLAIKVDVPGLIAGYESAFTCQVGCGPGGTNCLTAFDTAAFRAAVLANVSIE